MAEPITIAQLIDASEDAQTLALFSNADAATQVPRRLAEPIETLEYWRNYMSALTKGRDGVDASIDSLTVTTGAAGTVASVVTGGTPTARTFALTIPRGDKGLDGSFTQKSYTTYALMDADKINIPANTSVTITNDTDTTKNGMYAYNGTVFTKSAYDPLTQAKVDATTKDTAVKSELLSKVANAFSTKDLLIASTLANNSFAVVVADTDASKNGYYEKKAGIWEYSLINSAKNSSELTTLLANLGTSSSSKYAPILADANNKILIGYDYDNEKPIIAGLDLASLGEKGLTTGEDERYIPLLVDSKNNILIGYDKEKEESIVTGLKQAELVLRTPKLNPLVAKEVNHFLIYGQSLTLGVSAPDVLSSTQPYSNLTFNTYPRMDEPATGIIPLTEQYFVPEGLSGRAETLCSGAGNYASRAMMLENSVNPASHVIFASTAGRGSTTIDSLAKGGIYYTKVIEHITKAMQLNSPKTYKVQVCGWLQGESDAGIGVSNAPYAIYKAKLAQMQKNISDDAKAITGQTEEVDMITYQVSYNVRTWSDVALAQLDLAKENPNFSLATPMYHVEYADGLHLTSVGYKHVGAYFGRAYKQRVIEGRKPDFLAPLSAKLKGSTITISFDVPKSPLVFDTDTLAVTANGGFKILDNLGAELAIQSRTANANTVVIELTTAPIADVTVRYALDSIGAGLMLSTGASGNLRDSTTDTVMIAGLVKPLYHVCPHFKLTAFLDKGI